MKSQFRPLCRLVAILSLILFVCASRSAKGSVILLDTYGGEPSATSIGFGDRAPGWGMPEPINSQLAIRFTVNEPVSSIVVTAVLADFYGTGGLPFAGLYGSAESGEGLGTLLGSALSSESQTVPLTFDEPVSFAFETDLVLNAGLSYWLVLSAKDGDSFMWMSSDVDAPSVWISTNGGEWTVSGATSGRILIEGVGGIGAVPEPTSCLLGAVGLGMLAMRRRAARSTFSPSGN